MSIKTLIAAALCAGFSALAHAEPTRDYLHIVGSTTVHPFSSMVVARFVESTGFKSPLVQATGSGGGLMLFCAGIGAYEPDITYASRRMRKSEYENCRNNGVDEIVEIKLGYDGVVIANALPAPPLPLALKDIFLALAKEVPDPAGGEQFVANPHKTWKQVNPALPDTDVRVLGPARGSGTRHVFARMAMEGGCRTFDWIRALKREDGLRYKQVCRTLREDGAYIEASEKDSATLRQLASDTSSSAILSFGVVEQNRETVRGNAIDDINPGFGSIADEHYPLSRPLYLYVKKAHVDRYPGIREFLREFTSDKAWGDSGYLLDAGLVPMPAKIRSKYAEDAERLTPLSM